MKRALGQLWTLIQALFVLFILPGIIFLLGLRACGQDDCQRTLQHNDFIDDIPVSQCRCTPSGLIQCDASVP